MPQANQTRLRETVCIFDSTERLDAAIAELETTAFPRQDISVLGRNRDHPESDGNISAVRTELLEDDIHAPRAISIRPEEKTIGASAIIGACAYICGCFAAILAQNTPIVILLASITGGSVIGLIIGAAIVWVIAKKMNAVIKEQLHNGGLLLWVRTAEPEKERTARDIMRKYGGRHIHKIH